MSPKFKEQNGLEYKGFFGSVDFSEEDNVFFGKIEGIDGLVNYEGRNPTEVEQAFNEAVNDYIEIQVSEVSKAP